MNKEEKEAIDILENQIADYVIGDFCVGKYCPQEDTCKNDDCPFEKAIDIVVNLINKQQKEIEELKNDKSFLLDDLEGCIAKDKIREKIKELEKECETEVLTTWLESKIEVLQELLGEENE